MCVSKRVHADTRLVSSSGGKSERKKERERVFLVLQGVRGDKNRETLYRFVGRAAFTIFLRAARQKTPVNLTTQLRRTLSSLPTFYSHNLIISAL